MKIAYICYEGELLQGLSDEDSLLLAFLQQKGLDIHREVWTDAAVNWEQYQLVILKSPWDYIDHIAAFYSWLGKLERLGIRLLNPYDIVRWNSDKHYIREMMDADLPVIPAVYIEKGTQPLWPAYFSNFNTDKLIVKPCISGGSKNTFVVTPGKLPALVFDEAFMVQPFMPEILEGEWSFLFFNGAFSHCLLKRPVAGEFRVQRQFGGSAEPQTPPAAYLATALSFVERYAKGCLYARVDGVVKEGRFLLMELELIEPLLFLSTSEQYEHYYQALKQIDA
jgi:glutathione synthase/RimK-type ligase-like ATP-grasp enzyme